jgi:hypothetical protein
MNNAQWTVIIVSGVIALILLLSYGNKSSVAGQITLLLQNIFSGPKVAPPKSPVIGGGGGSTGGSIFQTGTVTPVNNTGGYSISSGYNGSNGYAF